MCSPLPIRVYYEFMMFGSYRRLYNTCIYRTSALLLQVSARGSNLVRRFWKGNLPNSAFQFICRLAPTDGPNLRRKDRGCATRAQSKSSPMAQATRMGTATMAPSGDHVRSGNHVELVGFDSQCSRAARRSTFQLLPPLQDGQVNLHPRFQTVMSDSRHK